MDDRQCVRFLQWALPQLHMRWPGFRKVRGQLRKGLDRRMRDLGLASADEYRGYLGNHADEWQHLDAMCRITVSRFYRDKAVFATLTKQVLPALTEEAQQRGGLRAWSAGCASGEEPYTLSILWRCELQSRYAGMDFDVVATDANPVTIDRAREARYEFSSLRELPEPWRDAAFEREDDGYRLRSAYRRGVQFVEQDIRETRPDGEDPRHDVCRRRAGDRRP